jgi:hypothetical protein
VSDQYLLETRHHSAVSSIRFNGDTVLVESDEGGGGWAATVFLAFDLSRGKFDEVLHTYLIAAKLR